MMYVSAEKYLKMKEESKEHPMAKMMLEMAAPVDLNGAYVALDKEDPKNLEMSAECTNDRFGLS